MERAGAGLAPDGAASGREGKRMSRFRRGGQAMARATLAVAAMLWPVAGGLAQTAPASSGAPADTVGPGELRDFSLGNRTAPATTPAVQPDLIATPRRPAARPPAPTDRISFPIVLPRPRPAPTASPTVTVELPQGNVTATPALRSAARAGETTTIALAPADPLSRRPTPAGDADVPRLSSQPIGAQLPLDTVLPDDLMGSLLPWLIGLLLVAGAALAWTFRHRWSAPVRPEPALAGGPPMLPREFSPPPPAPAPKPAPRISEPAGGITIKRPDPFADPRPAPAPAAPPPPRPLGIVSTRLRPWLDISFEPSRATIDEAQANVTFDVVVTNSGNAPARQVLVEACMVNAGPEQDIELRRFFEAPVGAGDRIDAIPPLGKIQLKSAVSLPLEQVRAYEVGGRKLFVPLVAFNALYEWGSNEGQSSAAFILGRGTAGGEGEPAAKMAPLRLDLGPRVFRELDSRRHSLGMRR